MDADDIDKKKTVGLFVTCLVDMMRPSVGRSALILLEAGGYHVDVPRDQTCCGQPNYNNGDRAGAKAMASRTIEILQGYDYVVVPSGSCAAMLKVHYPTLFEEGSREKARAEDLSERTWELLSFLRDVAGMTSFPGEASGTAVYHDACSGLRELGIKDQPRDLLGNISELEVREMREPEICCGFGGTFCVKYPEISNRMVENIADDVASTGADMVLTGDVGCLLNIEGKLHRAGQAVRVHHAAEVLAGLLEARDES